MRPGPSAQPAGCRRAHASPAERCLAVAFGGAVVGVQAVGARALGLADWLLGHLAEPAGPTLGPGDCLVRQSPATGHLCVYDGTELAYLGDAPPEAASILLSLVCRRLAAGGRGGLLLHAAAVSGPRGGLLLPGAPNSGKTTLALWLARHGYRYLTDELAFVPDGAPSLCGLSRPLAARAGSRFAWQQLAARPEDVLSGSSFDLLHPRLFGPLDPAPVRLSAIVLPQRVADRPPGLRPLGRAEAAFRLLGHLTNGPNLPQGQLEAARQLTRRAPTLRLDYPDVRLVPELLDELPT